MKLVLLSINFIFISLIAISQQSYFQQKVDTYIEVELDDQAHILRGFEKIIYHNNSPKKLDSIIIHLWPNAYKNNQTELAIQKFENGASLRF